MCRSKNGVVCFLWLARMASFGRAQDVSIVGEVVYCDPLHADGKLRNVRELRGNVVCIPHGGASSPQEKALRAFHAGVVAVILIADSEDTHAVAADHSLALDKSSNMMATVKFKDVGNDMWKVELRMPKRGGLNNQRDSGKGREGNTPK